MKNLVITGSIAYDYLMRFPGRFADNLMADQLHQISVSFLVKEMVKRRGGNAPNIAYTIALLGGRPIVMGTAGCDFAEYGAWLNAQGVDTSAIEIIEDVYTASFFANTDSEQNQIASFYAGAMDYAGQLSFARNAPSADLVIVSPNEPAAMQQYMRECKQSGIPYIYDPSQQTIWLSGEELTNGLTGCTMLTINSYEHSLIQEKTGLNPDQILERAGAVLITKGKDGATLQVDGEQYNFPTVPPRQVLDPTGAGDAYRAGLMRAIQLDLPWEIAGRMAALCATWAIEHLGTQEHHFTPQQFIARFREHFDDQGHLDRLLQG
jgi:adenosine kinase